MKRKISWVDCFSWIDCFYYMRFFGRCPQNDSSFFHQHLRRTFQQSPLGNSVKCLAPVGVSALFRFVAQQPSTSYVAIVMLNNKSERFIVSAPFYTFKPPPQRNLELQRLNSGTLSCTEISATQGRKKFFVFMLIFPKCFS